MRRLSRAAAALAFGATIFACRPALAEEPAPPPQQPQEEYTNEQLGARVRSWYGWQTMLVDAAAFGAVFAGYGANDFHGNPITTIGAVSYVFAAPIVHWIHGHAGKGIIDMGLRLLVPAITGGLGYLFLLPADTSGNNNDPSTTASTVGLGVGALGMAIVDAVFFGFESKYDMSAVAGRRPGAEPDAGRRPGAEPGAPSLLPRLDVRGGPNPGATMGVGGVF